MVRTRWKGDDEGERLWILVSKFRIYNLRFSVEVFFFFFHSRYSPYLLVKLMGMLRFWCGPVLGGSYVLVRSQLLLLRR